MVLGGRKSLWGAFVGATLVALLPNLLSNPALFRAFACVGFAMALVAGVRGLLRRSTRPFQALAPVVATGVLVLGSFLQKNTEDWRKAIFALMLFSVVVGLPEGLMGFAAGALARLFRVAPPPLPPAAPARRRAAGHRHRRRAAAGGEGAARATSAACGPWTASTSRSAPAPSTA